MSRVHRDAGAQIYLASASPRRRQLLAGVGLRCDVVAAHIDESVARGEAAEAYVTRMAVAKASAVLQSVRRKGLPELPVLGADTCVVLDARIFGKPADADEAADMLRALSGREHLVLSALALATAGSVRTSMSRTRVRFKVLSEREIAAYWATGEPRDKAGAYAIQGLAAGFVSRIEGSFTGVVGLPMFELRELLQQVGMDWL